MAQIKLGNFGNVTPGRAPQVSTPQTGAAAAALANVGNAALEVATDMRAQQTRRDLVEVERQRAQAEAAEKAKEAAALLDAEDKLRDMHDEVAGQMASGQIETRAAEGVFNERAKEVSDAVMQAMRPENREVVATRLQRHVNTLGNSMRRQAEKRDRQVVTAAIGSQLETFERLYRTDPAGAEKGASALISQLGPWSDLTPEQLGRLGQNWREKTQFTAGFEAVSFARESRKGLAEAEKLIGALPDLDPQKRAQLIDRAQAYRMALDQKAEMAARRAEAERDRILRRAEHAANAFQLLTDKGTALDPAYIDRAMQETAGTPYQAAIKGMAEQARTTGGIAAQPLAVQEDALRQIDALIAKNGRSPELDKRREQIEKVARGSRADLEKDALRAGLERGVITEITPLNMAAGLQTIPDQLRARVESAQRVQRWAGRPVSPLTDEEASTVKRQLDALPVRERSTIIAALAQTVGPDQAIGLATQIDKKDRALALSMASAASRTTEGRFTSELILKGQQAKEDGTSTKGEKQPDVKASSWRAHAAGALDGVFANQQFSTQVRDAAELIMHGIAAESGGRLSRDDMDRAIGLAIGGTLVEHNGRKIPLPAGVTEDMLTKRLETMTPGEVGAPVVIAGGKRIGADELVKALPAQKLMPVRPGEFAILVGERPVTDEGGNPIIVKVQ